MAEVDFSNAIIEPANLTNWINPTAYQNISIDNGFLRDASGNAVSTDVQRTVVVNDTKQLVYLYHGTFTTNGTEFYLRRSESSVYAGWRISNISFNSGDTYTFTINATLTCN